MPFTIRNIEPSIHKALLREKAVWSPQCPEPETLLDWIEQEDAHTQAAPLLEHLSGCAYCRREYADLRAIRLLADEPARTPAWAPEKVSGRVRKWARQLVTDGLATPVESARAALDRIHRAVAPPAPLLVRGGEARRRDEETVSNLRPTFTAIRSLRPVLRWSDAGMAQEYFVALTRQTNRKVDQWAWQGSAGVHLNLTLPEQAQLEPGGVYLWQVTARAEGMDYHSPRAGFVVLTEPMQSKVKVLEREAENSALALIGVYEAYGLYEEALEIAEGLPHDTDAASLLVRTSLLRQLQGD